MPIRPRGLGGRAFDAAEAQLFRGRERLLRELLGAWKVAGAARLNEGSGPPHPPAGYERRCPEPFTRSDSLGEEGFRVFAGRVLGDTDARAALVRGYIPRFDVA